MWYYQPIAEFAVYFVGFVIVYVAPAALALYRDTRHAMLIAAFNVLLGWTIVGWAAAFLLACLLPVARHQGRDASEEAPASRD